MMMRLGRFETGKLPALVGVVGGAKLKKSGYATLFPGEFTVKCPRQAAKKTVKKNKGVHAARLERNYS